LLKEAEDACQRAIALNPEIAEPHNHLGIIFEKQEKTEEAKAEYQKVIETKPGFGQAHNNLAVVYFYQKNYALAFEQWKTKKNLSRKLYMDLSIL